VTSSWFFIPQEFSGVFLKVVNFKSVEKQSEKENFANCFELLSAIFYDS